MGKDWPARVMSAFTLLLSRSPHYACPEVIRVSLLLVWQHDMIAHARVSIMMGERLMCGVVESFSMLSWWLVLAMYRG